MIQFSVYQPLAQKKTKHNGHIRKHADFSAKESYIYTQICIVLPASSG